MTVTVEPVATRSLRITDPYDPRANAETFDLDGYLAQFNPRLLGSTEGRQTLTRYDPLLFALIYHRKHLRDALGRVTFADAHFEWLRYARRWARKTFGLRAGRKAFVAPRACGKTTWWFLILPMWAAAHGHVRFAAAFADSGTQAELHLATFKRELSDNALLRRDYIDLCEPARRHNGKTINDSQQMLYSRSGFAFAARGIDSTSLGMKIDEHRPDLILFDDIEPDASNYSTYQIEKRLSTVQNAILPLNETARVVLIGTVTMPGSLVHQLVRHNKGHDQIEWIQAQRFEVLHTPPIVTREDGTERSVWPAKWPLEYLLEIRGTESYQLNFANDPRAYSGKYWSSTDIRHGLPEDPVTKVFIWVDPPVTAKARSDPAGIAVVGYVPPVRIPSLRVVQQFTEPAAVVYHAEGTQKTGKPLARHIAGLIARIEPEIGHKVLAVIVEANQGGDLWKDVMDVLPVRLITYTVSESKEVRFSKALDFYQRGRVYHAKVLEALEDQYLSYPNVQHEDVADAACAGVLRLLAPKEKSGSNRTLYPS